MKEWIAENWPMLLAAVGAGFSAFASMKTKKTPTEKKKAKAEKLERKANKHLDKAKAEIASAEELKKEISKNA